MSSTGLKSLAGLTRARHRGNVAPSNRDYSKGPRPGALFLSTEDVTSSQHTVGLPRSHMPAIGINHESGNHSFNEK